MFAFREYVRRVMLHSAPFHGDPEGRKILSMGQATSPTGAGGEVKGEFAIERSTTIAAPPARVFALIENLRNWERWNPNGRADPTVQRAYTGPVAGTGAAMTWRGSRSGAGAMEVTSATPDAEVIVVVSFERPFKVTNRNRFTLEPEGGGTRVTWAMRGPKPLLAKIVGLVMNMERMLGRHFEDGLAALKSLAENPANEP
jgi:uncharacterized protein YndB with AHSA1/START domain